MNRNFPFDPSLKHHFYISIGLAIWIFVFLFTTEPLDVSEFTELEMLIYMPLYGLLGAICYLLILPLQGYLFHKKDKKWTLFSEFIFLTLFCIISVFLARMFYLFAVVPNEPNPYSFTYHFKSILFPALLTILPIVIIGRYAFGKFKEKQLEATKIEISGEGNYEGLRLFKNDLICIQSADNYIEVHYLSGEVVKKTLIRNKLSTIEKEHKDLVRTHRSYIINPYHFMQWKTNNGKLFVELSHSIFTPVSNTYKNEVKSILNSTTTEL